MFEGQTPEKVLERIQVGNDVWCLVKFPDTANQNGYIRMHEELHVEMMMTTMMMTNIMIQTAFGYLRMN